MLFERVNTMPRRRILRSHTHLWRKSMRPFVARSVLAIALAIPARATGATEPLSCPWCGAAEAPASLTATARIAPADEPGVPLEVSGTVYHADGRTPAAGVLLYAYQTNAQGVFPRRGSETGEHGYLRGWVRTDAQGHYRILTIRPAPERGVGEPARIQMTVRPDGSRETLIDPVEFADDALLTSTVRARRRAIGGSGIVRPVADPRGVLHAVRDIVLERVS
jgi:protocatechuate 3,4-dioxygenase, beta subunit